VKVWSEIFSKYAIRFPHLGNICRSDKGNLEESLNYYTKEDPQWIIASECCTATKSSYRWFHHQQERVIIRSNNRILRGWSSRPSIMVPNVENEITLRHVNVAVLYKHCLIACATWIRRGGYDNSALPAWRNNSLISHVLFKYSVAF